MKAFITILTIVLLIVPTGRSAVPVPQSQSTTLARTVPRVVEDVIAAAVRVGHLTREEFVTRVRAEAENTEVLAAVDRSGLLLEVPQMREVLLKRRVYDIGTHEGTGFKLEVYYTNEDITYIRCFAPLVRGTRDQNNTMLETMAAVSETFVGKNENVRTWIQNETRESWRVYAQYYQKKIDSPKDALRKRQFGAYLLVVWGVPPDFLELWCVKNVELSVGVAPHVR